jgi:hypothetical protein
MLSYPDYERSIINAVASITGYYRVPSRYPSIPALDDELGKYFKNVVVIVLSGMGRDMLLRNLPPHYFLSEQDNYRITSVFPSSTVAALTSWQTGLSPNEHAWLGRSLYFSEFHRTIDILANQDAYSKTPFNRADAADFVMPHETIYRDVKKSIIGNVQPFTVSSGRIAVPERGNYHKTVEDFMSGCETVKKICETKQNTLTFFLWDEPYLTARKHGCYAEETEDLFRKLDRDISMLYGGVTDTLFIISADHGMADLEEEILLHQYPEIKECLVIPPFCEGRAASFYVKYDKRSDFERYFHNYFSGEFILLSKRDILSKEILGGGKTHPKTLDFIGEYMGCSIGAKTFCYRTLDAKPQPMGRAASGGFTDGEMIIPLIVAPTRRTVKPALKIF